MALIPREARWHRYQYRLYLPLTYVSLQLTWTGWWLELHNVCVWRWDAIYFGYNFAGWVLCSNYCTNVHLCSEYPNVNWSLFQINPALIAPGLTWNQTQVYPSITLSLLCGVHSLCGPQIATIPSGFSRLANKPLIYAVIPSVFLLRYMTMRKFAQCLFWFLCENPIVDTF